VETRAVVAQTTLAVIVPGFPDQGELETVTFTRSVSQGHTRKIVLQYAGLQHFLISGAEVDESKIACAGETDAGETCGCWDTSPEEEHALLAFFPPRDVDGIGERPAPLQHRLAYMSHQLPRTNCFRTRTMPRASIQSHLDVVLALGLVLDSEATLGNGLSYTFTFLLAVDQS